MDSLLEARVQVHVVRFAEDAGHALDSLRDTLGGLQEHLAPFGDSTPGQQPQSLDMLGQYMREETVFAAYQDLFILGGLLSVVTLALVFLLPGRRQEEATRVVESPSRATP